MSNCLNLKVVITDESEYAVADAKVLEWYEEILSEKPETVFIASDIQLTCLRLGQAKKEINVLHVLYGEQEFSMNSFGIIENHPRELFGSHADVLGKLIKEQCALRRLAREEKKKRALENTL